MNTRSQAMNPLPLENPTPVESPTQTKSPVLKILNDEEAGIEWNDEDLDFSIVCCLYPWNLFHVHKQVIAILLSRPTCTALWEPDR